MKIWLKKSFFEEKEYTLIENGQMRVTAFKYSTGVEALKIENSKGNFIILPFQGQQIWRAQFLGKELTMKTLIDEPVKTNEYLKNYGGFILHCGLDAIGVPQEDDKHSLHGELPNAEYNKAYIECNEEYIAVGGSLYMNESLNRNYVFSPECRLYKDDTILKLFVSIENRRCSPMEYMYLCHINFRPFDGAELIYSAFYDKDNIEISKIISDNTPEDKAKELLEYMVKLEEKPQIHHIIDKNQPYDPEICMFIKYMGDEDNRAYTLQKCRDGACYVSHSVDILPKAVRWIARNGNEDCMGMVLPATAEHLGYMNAKRKGQIKVLEPNEKLVFCIEAGYIDSKKALDIENKIEAIKKGEKKNEKDT